MMSLTFGLFTQVNDSGPQGSLVFVTSLERHKVSVHISGLLNSLMFLDYRLI